MKKQKPIYISLEPQLQKKVDTLEREVTKLKNEIFKHKRNEKRYRRALYEVLNVQLDLEDVL